MFIRRTTIKSRSNGESYFTYRLVESERIQDKVRQRTLINLGRYFDVCREQWPMLTQRIEQIIKGQSDFLPLQLSESLEEVAQSYAAAIIHSKSCQIDQQANADYQSVDVTNMQMIRPRSVGVEHVAFSAAQQVGLDDHLKAIGFNGVQCQTAMASIIARMVYPASGLATHQWLQQTSGLDELM